MFDNDLIHSLSKSKIFNGFSSEDLKMISPFGQLEKFEQNSILIHEGEIGEALYVIIKGQVEVFLPAKKGRATKIKLSRLTQGDCLGEYSVIDNNPASASAAVLEACDIFEIPKNNFERIINSKDRFAKQIYLNMLQILIERSRASDKELDLCYIY